MKGMKKKKGKIEITDKELEQAIRDRLNADPVYYLNFLRKLIDKTNGEISDEILLESLKPSFTRNPTLEEILSGQKISSNINYSLIPSPKSVDMLFYPHVRRKLKEWQQTFFDKESTDSQKLKAEENLQKVFKRLLYIGQGRQKGLSSEAKKIIRLNFREVDLISRKIFQESKKQTFTDYEKAEGKLSKTHKETLRRRNRNVLIRGSFPEVSHILTTPQNFITSPQKLRNMVLKERVKLAKNIKCSDRDIEECVREFRVRQVGKAFEKLIKGKKEFITVRGSGKKVKISVS